MADLLNPGSDRTVDVYKDISSGLIEAGYGFTVVAAPNTPRLVSVPFARDDETFVIVAYVGGAAMMVESALVVKTDDPARRLEVLQQLGQSLPLVRGVYLDEIDTAAGSATGRQLLWIEADVPLPLVLAPRIQPEQAIEPFVVVLSAVNLLLERYPDDVEMRDLSTPNRQAVLFRTATRELSKSPDASESAAAAPQPPSKTQGDTSSK